VYSSDSAQLPICPDSGKYYAARQLGQAGSSSPLQAANAAAAAPHGSSDGAGAGPVGCASQGPRINKTAKSTARSGGRGLPAARTQEEVDGPPSAIIVTGGEVVGMELSYQR
jgi:hypothetical protein